MKCGGTGCPHHREARGPWDGQGEPKQSKLTQRNWTQETCNCKVKTLKTTFNNQYLTYNALQMQIHFWQAIFPSAQFSFFLQLPIVNWNCHLTLPLPLLPLLPSISEAASAMDISLSQWAKKLKTGIQNKSCHTCSLDNLTNRGKSEMNWPWYINMQHAQKASKANVCSEVAEGIDEPTSWFSLLPPSECQVQPGSCLPLAGWHVQVTESSLPMCVKEICSYQRQALW